MKRDIPDTFAVLETVETGWGSMPVKKKRGEGGSSSLAKRIADCFQNKFLRYREITLNKLMK